MRCKRNATETFLDASKIIVSVVQGGSGIVKGKETDRQKIGDCQYRRCWTTNVGVARHSLFHSFCHLKDAIHAYNGTKISRAPCCSKHRTMDKEHTVASPSQHSTKSPIIAWCGSIWVHNWAWLCGCR
ncbi:hypothetical protein SCLCIDRAFT_739031 [Scleroderma citrinum Foug A]|uniref:Uncharacterized protein n=1 Tax=Scleroderma citrinum Foug A TaxID=1036808 RepID=A0A0C2ZQ77_9AGAM|nr:hypothetical protein SCLCIDRAFT_739031 [Scleroderma citrinum Foug A]